jgi:hypothetical protein
VFNLYRANQPRGFSQARIFVLHHFIFIDTDARHRSAKTQPTLWIKRDNLQFRDAFDIDNDSRLSSRGAHLDQQVCPTDQRTRFIPSRPKETERLIE